MIDEISTKLEKKILDLNTVFDISKEINSTYDIDDIMNIIIFSSMGRLGTGNVGIFYENRQHQFQLRNVRGFNSNPGLIVEISQNESQYFVNEDRALLSSELKEKFPKASLTNFIIKEDIRAVIPMIFKGKLRGLFIMGERYTDDNYHPDDLEFINILSHQAVIAMENALHIEEVEKLAADLKATLERERHITIEKEKMGKYISKELIDEIHKNREKHLALGGTIKNVAILFSDIRGFTSMSEQLAASDIVHILNKYMTEMARIIEKEKGVIDKYIGDCIMVVYPASEDGDDKSLRAVRSAVKMLERLKELNKEFVAEGFSEIKIGIGINTGEVIAGNVGADVRMDYTVIGDNVNTAARLEENAGPGEILITESTYKDVKEFIKVKDSKVLRVKGKSKGVMTYQVTALK